MYSGNYVARCHRKHFWINVLCQRGLVKSHRSHKCYINTLMNLNNCIQRGQKIKHQTLFIHMNIFSNFEKRPPKIYFNYLQIGQIQNLEIFLTSVKRKMPNIQCKSLRQSQTHIFSLMLLCFDSSIRWMCSDRQLFALGTNGRNGRWHVLAYTSQQRQKQVVTHGAALHWHSAGNVWKVGQINDIPH